MMEKNVVVVGVGGGGGGVLLFLRGLVPYNQAVPTKHRKSF